MTTKAFYRSCLSQPGEQLPMVGNCSRPHRQPSQPIPQVQRMFGRSNRVLSWPWLPLPWIVIVSRSQAAFSDSLAAGDDDITAFSVKVHLGNGGSRGCRGVDDRSHGTTTSWSIPLWPELEQHVAALNAVMRRLVSMMPWCEATCRIAADEVVVVATEDGGNDCWCLMKSLVSTLISIQLSCLILAIE